MIAKDTGLSRVKQQRVNQCVIVIPRARVTSPDDLRCNLPEVGHVAFQRFGEYCQALRPDCQRLHQTSPRSCADKSQRTGEVHAEV